MTTTPTPRSRRHRWRFSQSIVEMHYELRTEADTPVRQALSIWLGVWIGCTPLWGVHLLMCAGLAKLFGLPRVKCYLAAHINNPLTAPFLLFAEALTGHWMLTQEWLSVSLADFRQMSVFDLGRDILLGSLLVGFVLGAFFAAIAFVISLRWREPPLHARLKEETARTFRDTGVFNWEFVRGRLRYDPIYYHLISSGDLPRNGRVLDLGCGRGILLALIRGARSIFEHGDWPVNLPEPPSALTLIGVESHPKRCAIAQQALGDKARVHLAHLDEFALPSCQAVILLDILHHLQPDEQISLLRRCHRALEPGGILFLREQNSAAGIRFIVKRAGLRLWAIARGERKSQMFFRELTEWTRLLRECGFTSEVQPVTGDKGQPSELIVARRSTDRV